MSSIISYAQNFEDVMLWRALSHVGDGFYIDIGAQDPVVDSVSMLFHERGWRGIHVEPTPYYAELLRRARPDDIVIEAAVGLDQHEILPYFEIPLTGISTADPEIAERHRAHGLEVREIRVPSITLASVFRAANQHDVHWLKIDVEGFERQVLSGWDARGGRPWIVVVESTLPLTRIESHQGWEPLLLRYGYKPVYFDGLNRYYVSLDHPELEKSFSLPPNIFDDFALNGTASSPFHRLIVARYEEELEAARSASQAARGEAAADSARYGKRVEQLELEVGCRQQELAARADEVLALTARYRAEVEAARVETEAVRSASLRAAREKESLILRHAELLQDSMHREKSLLEQVETLQAELMVSRNIERELTGRILGNQEGYRREVGILIDRHKEIETAVNREREVHALRVHELTIALRTQEGALDASARALAASESREQSLVTQVGVLHGELAASRSLQRGLTERLLEKHDRLRREIEVLMERHNCLLQLASAERRSERDVIQNELGRTQAELDETRGALRAAELAVQGQAEALRQSANHKRHLEESIACFGEQLRSECEQSIAAKIKVTAVQAELADLKRSASWRLTAPLRMLRRRSRSPVVQSSSLCDHTFQANASSPVQKIDVVFQGAPHPMISNTDERPLIAPATDMNGLLVLLHEDFVECAYRTIFRRNADAEGLAHYTARVLAGDRKIEILRDLYLSDEARQAAVYLPWLHEAIVRYQRRSSPLRRLLRRFRGREGSHEEMTERVHLIEERLSHFERNSIRACNELANRIRSAEEMLSRLNNVVKFPQAHPAESGGQLERSVTSNEADSGTRGTNCSQAEKTPEMSLVTKRILRDLVDAIGDARMAASTRTST